jgi:hypothetical protein
MINSLKKITLYFFPHCHNLSKNAKHQILILAASVSGQGRYVIQSNATNDRFE